MHCVDAAVQFFECPPQVVCSTASVHYECQTSGRVLVWRVTGNAISKIKLIFTVRDENGTSKVQGNFTAKLIQQLPATSLLTFGADLSLDGIWVECIDGLDGNTRACQVATIGER